MNTITYLAERSWYIKPDEKVLGRFSKAFMIKIDNAFGVPSKNLAAGSTK